MSQEDALKKKSVTFAEVRYFGNYFEAPSSLSPRTQWDFIIIIVPLKNYFIGKDNIPRVLNKTKQLKL